jgi:hypothetical protein
MTGVSGVAAAARAADASVRSHRRSVGFAPRNVLHGRSGIFVRICLTAVIAVNSAAAGIKTVTARYTDSAGIPSNTFHTGTVDISDNGGSASILTLSNAAVGATSTGCINVTNTGSLSSTVRMYGSVTGTGLDAYLSLTITRGTMSSSSFPSCTNFTADSATYSAAGGVVYSGTLANFVTTRNNYTNGLVDPTAGTPETWTNSEVHAYKFAITVQSGANGLNATPTFTWEAQST